MLLGVVCATPAYTDDFWELGSIPLCPDDTASTCNQLLPGSSQVHDLQGVAASRDQDWMVVDTKARRSYEVDARGASLAFGLNPSACVGCAEVARVDSAGAVLTQGVSVEGSYPYGDTSVRQGVRWIAGATNQREWIRVLGFTFLDLTANDRYEIVLRDTTLQVPRWNNTASQTTVFIISSQSPAAVAGSIFFYNGTGTLVHTAPLSVPVFGVQVLSTASIPALAGLSGHATVAHDGGWNALAGKAVALEPATGFTFDTAMSTTSY
jgi:hypothetical protein